jgi:hypothetical protein
LSALANLPHLLDRHFDLAQSSGGHFRVFF